MTVVKSNNNDSSDNITYSKVKYVPTNAGKLKAVDGSQNSDTFFLYFSILSGCLPLFAGATSFAWSSPVLPKLQSNDTLINPLNVPITTVDISLMIGLPCLTGIPGSLLTAPISNSFGRKRCLQLAALGMLLCNMVIAFSNRAIYIIITRCVFFLFFSAVSVITPIFVTEMSEDYNRAKFGCLMGFLPPAGTMYSFALGPVFSVRNFTLITNIPSILGLMFLFFVPETPVFSVSKNRFEECQKTLSKLRSNKSVKEIELDFSKLCKDQEMQAKNKVIGVASLFKTKAGRIGFLFAFIPTILLYLTGVPSMMSFLGPIFNGVATGLSGNTVAVAFGVLKCILFLVTSFIVERTGRKPLLLYSSIGCGVSTCILAVFFYLKHNNSSVIHNLGWIPLAAFALLIVSFSLGLGPVPPSLVGEMFMSEVRAAASASIITLVGLVVFTISSAFPILAKYFGLHVCFGLFAVCSLLGAVFIHVMLPETRGKSFIEIQNLLNNYKFNLKRK